MPQMAPLSWLTLMTIFIMVMTMFNVLNFYSFNPLMKKSETILEKKISMNWKW